MFDFSLKKLRKLKSLYSENRKMISVKFRILIIIFWNFTMFQYRSTSPQVKTNLISNFTNLAHKLPLKLKNDFRFLKNIRNVENITKFQIWVERKGSALSLHKKVYPGHNSQRTCKRRYQTFLVFPNFTAIFTLVQFLLRTVRANQVQYTPISYTPSCIGFQFRRFNNYTTIDNKSAHFKKLQRYIINFFNQLFASN